MTETQATQLERIKTKRLWLLYASIACSLLASLATWTSISLKPDSEAIAKQAAPIDERFDSLSDRLSKLTQEQEQFENEISSISKEESGALPDALRAEKARIKNEARAIRSEFDTLTAEIDSLDKRFRTSPAQKALIITVAILVGFQLIFLIAYLNSQRGVSLKDDVSDATDHYETQLSYRSIE